MFGVSCLYGGSTMVNTRSSSATKDTEKKRRTSTKKIPSKERRSPSQSKQHTLKDPNPLLSTSSTISLTNKATEKSSNKRKPAMKTNTLVLKYPELVKEWHPTMNDRTPDQVTTGSHYKAWWICLVDPRHTWQAAVFSRVQGCGCSSCAGRKVD